MEGRKAALQNVTLYTCYKVSLNYSMTASYGYETLHRLKVNS